MENPTETHIGWHAQTVDDVCRQFDGDLSTGLTQEKIARFVVAKPPATASIYLTAARVFADQWKGSIILILSAAAVSFWFLGQHKDAIGITVSIFFATILGFITDFRSQRALAELKSLTAPSALVIRESLILEIPTIQIVPGDIIVLRAGNKVPTDGRLVESSGLQIDESALTGESLPQTKKIRNTP
jgi:Ca2+-transporting ATPase